MAGGPPNGGSAWRARLEDLFFLGVVAVVPAPLFAASASYWGLLFLAILFVVYVAAGGWRRFRLTPMDAPVVAFVAIRFLSTLTSVAPAASWGGMGKSCMYLAYIPVAHMALGRARRLAGVYIYLAAVILAAAVGIAEFAFGGETRVVSRTAGYTTFAGMLAVALCMFAAAAAFARGRRLLGIAAGALTPLAALVFTFCRGQWLALAAGLGLIGAWKDRRIFVVLIALVALAATAAYFAPAGVASGRFSLGDPAFENYRDILWRGGLVVLFARPLTGFGPETIKTVFPYQTRFYSPVAEVIGWHNDFIQLATESGLGGVAAALWLVGAAVFTAARAFRRATADTATRALGLGLIAATVTALVGGLVGNVATDPAMIIQFGVLWGLFAPLALGEVEDDAVP